MKYTDLQGKSFRMSLNKGFFKRIKSLKVFHAKRLKLKDYAVNLITAE